MRNKIFRILLYVPFLWFALQLVQRYPSGTELLELPAGEFSVLIGLLILPSLLRGYIWFLGEDQNPFTTRKPPLHRDESNFSE
jgi:hypothetical protein